MTASLNPVCPRCGLVMDVLTIGVEAVYMAHDPPEPHEIRSGDVCGCRGCGARVVVKWANTSLMAFEGQRFDDRLLAAGHVDKLIPVWERPADWHINLGQLVERWLAKRAEARKAQP